jgi:hypothetical protein
MLVLAALINVLNEKTVCPIRLLLPRTAHMPRYNVLSRINLAKTRLLTAHNSTRLVCKDILAELIPREKVFMVKLRNQSPKIRMNDVIVIQKVDQTVLYMTKSCISLTVSRARIWRTYVPIFNNLRVIKNLVVNSPRLGRIMDNNPLMDLVKSNRLVNLLKVLRP